MLKHRVCKAAGGAHPKVNHHERHTTTASSNASTQHAMEHALTRKPRSRVLACHLEVAAPGRAPLRTACQCHRVSCRRMLHSVMIAAGIGYTTRPTLRINASILHPSPPIAAAVKFAQIRPREHSSTVAVTINGGQARATVDSGSTFGGPC